MNWQQFTMDSARSAWSFLSVHLGQLVEAGLQFLVGGDVVGHLPVVEFLVGHHVEVARAGETKDDGLFLAGFDALFRLVNGDLDGVGAFRGGEDSLHPGEILGSFKDIGLLDGHGLHQSVIVQLGQG